MFGQVMLRQKSTAIRGRWSRRLVWPSLGLLAGAILWFASVDKAWSVVACPDCGLSRDVIQYRVFGVPIAETEFDHPTQRQEVATLLGAPCAHDRAVKERKQTWWGLVFCACPCINGTSRLDVNHPLADRVKQRLKTLGATAPKDAAEFGRRVLRGHDYEFYRRFMARLDE